MDEFLRACQNAVLDNDAKVVAAQLSVPHVSLLQRANPDNDSHRLTINHLFGILLHTGDMRPLAALANAFGYDLVGRHTPPAIDLMSSMQGIGKEVAELTLAVHQATDDGVVTQIEKAHIRREIDHVRRELNVMEQSVRSA